ncbi:proteasome assembly chaperone 4 [Copidosoma floridanum]|uniref:proteasome assembly chaperone 4 n=1 Tax=Copidosoma floridanum TaxID=29053 RepID=UPI0006C96B3B|nr:proteasome assembly chaperone 4 [Copidosoma floridanum]
MSVVDAVVEPKLLPCSFQFHSFHDKLNEVSIDCQIVKMEKSLYLWIGDHNDQSMKDLALAISLVNNDKKSTVSTKILGPIADELSSNIASRLSKKTGKPVYVSFNLNVDNLTLPLVERRIHQELKDNAQLLDI